MISFEYKPDPDLYDLLTKELELDFDGEKHTVTVHSLASYLVADARAKYVMRQDYADKKRKAGDDILVTKVKIDAGLGVEVDGVEVSDWAKKHNAMLAVACVEGYPESRDAFDDMLSNVELTNYIIGLAIELQNEFISKKKT